MDRNLLTFLSVARTQNITAAARELHITQPTLTKRLQQLERAYGCQLVARLPRGVRLTPFGEALLPYARRVECDLLQSREAVRAVASSHLDELNVGAGPLFQLRYLGPAFATLRTAFPDTKIRITADVNSRNLPKIRDGSQDIMFGTTEFLAEDDQISFFPMTIVEQALVLSARHRLADNKCISPDQLADLSWIVYSNTPENEEMAHSYCALHGLAPPNIILQTTSLNLCLQMVADSACIMTIPHQLKPTLDPQRLQVLRFDPAMSKKPAGAFIRKSALRYPIITRLVEIVRQSVQN